MQDSEFKDFVQKNWPTKTNIFDGGVSDFFRARPKLSSDKGTLPYICTAGQFDKFTKVPDGLYVKIDISEIFCDIVIIECCQTFQNFEQKRGKYGPSTSSLLLHAPKSWMTSQIDSSLIRASAMGFNHEDWDDDYKIAIRNMNVLYVIPNDLYVDVRKHCTPNHFEFFIKDTDFKSPTNNAVRTFLSRLDMSSRFFD